MRWKKIIHLGFSPSCSHVSLQACFLIFSAWTGWFFWYVFFLNQYTYGSPLGRSPAPSLMKQMGIYFTRTACRRPSNMAKLVSACLQKNNTFHGCLFNCNGIHEKATYPPSLSSPWPRGCLCIQSFLWIIARWARPWGIMAIFKTLEHSTALKDTLQLPHWGLLLRYLLITTHELKRQCLVQRQVSENTEVLFSKRRIFSTNNSRQGKHFMYTVWCLW